VRSFIEFYLEGAEELASEAGYVPFPAASYGEAIRALPGSIADASEDGDAGS
jgi:hypothetical protein